jgi:HlyD family secretion protein
MTTGLANYQTGRNISPSYRGVEVEMTKAKAGCMVIVLLAMGAAAGGGWWWYTHSPEPLADALVLYGNVDIRQVNLAFNGSEHVASMRVQEGDRVSKGQLLATLDTHRLEPAVARAEAQVQSQREVVARLVAGARPQEIRKARADVEAAAAELRDAERTYRRQRALATRDITSQQQADDAQAAVETAQARLQALQEALQLTIAGSRQEDIAAAKATLQVYKAELALARRELADAELYAPAHGIIQNRLLEPGDMASPQRPIYTLALTDPVWVRAYVSEPDLGKIRPGMPAQVSTDSFPDKRYPSWIGFISPTAEFTPKSVQTHELRTRLVYQVRVYVCNPQGELRLGMPARVIIPLSQPSGAETAGSGRCGQS